MIDGLRSMRRITRLEIALSALFIVVFVSVGQWWFGAAFGVWIVLNLRDLRRLNELELRMLEHMRVLQQGEHKAVLEALGFPENPGSQ